MALLGGEGGEGNCGLSPSLVMGWLSLLLSIAIPHHLFTGIAISFEIYLWPIAAMTLALLVLVLVSVRHGPSRHSSEEEIVKVKDQGEEISGRAGAGNGILAIALS